MKKNEKKFVFFLSVGLRLHVKISVSDCYQKQAGCKKIRQCFKNISPIFVTRINNIFFI